MALPGPVLVISPHLDDAVFGCSGLIAARPGCTVTTVFAGTPPPAASVTAWDAAAGFHADDDVMGRRRTEDARALAVLGATPCWLAFLDAQYAASPDVEQLADALRGECERVRPRTMIVPLGLFHSDHRLVGEACLRLLARLGGDTAWHAYEDALYRAHGGLVQRRLAELLDRGVIATPLAFGDGCDRAHKRDAVACYESQLRALRTKGLSEADLDCPERYWALRTP